MPLLAEILIFTTNTLYSSMSGSDRVSVSKRCALHELSLTQNIIDLAIEHAACEDAKKILSITLEIGALSGVVAEAVEFAFDICSKGTLAEGAVLEIRLITGRGRCLDCREEAEINTLTHVCPHCRSLALEIVQGQEMKFTEMEID